VNKPGDNIDTTHVKESVRWSELDFLRGLAACLMIATHLGFASCSYEESTLVATMTFLGGMAPVLFFLVTGLGYGVQSVSGRPRSNDRHLSKITILLMADAFLWLRPGQLVGNDFIGFIAISSLILDMVRRSSRSLAMSFGLIVLIIAARFAVGPLVRTHSQANDLSNLLGSVLGVRPLQGFSYPPSPWLVYPLMGYVLGRVAATNSRQIQARRVSVSLGLLLMASIPLTLGLLVLARGGILFRYSTMSIGFFLMTLPTIFIALAISLLLGRSRLGSTVAASLSLSGVRSFAIVPLHYLFLDLTRSLWGPVQGVWGYLLWVLMGVIFSFQLSKAVPWSKAWIESRDLAGAARLFVVVAVVLGVVFILTGSLGKLPDHLVRQGAQLGLCLLFGLLPVAGEPWQPITPRGHWKNRGFVTGKPPSR